MDIESINSINPKYWGYSGWVFLNSIALVYNPLQKQIYYNFFVSLKDILPCEKCKIHYSTQLELLNNALENKNTLLEWLLNIRNKINLEQNKKTKTLKDIFNEIFYKNNLIDKYLGIIVLILIFILLFKIL